MNKPYYHHSTDPLTLAQLIVRVLALLIIFTAVVLCALRIDAAAEAYHQATYISSN